MELDYEQKIYDVVRKQFSGNSEAETYLDSICWQIGERGGSGFKSENPLLVRAVDLVSGIALRYADPVNALKIIDKKLSQYQGVKHLEKLSELYGKGLRILERQPSLIRLANRSLDFRLEEILHGPHLRSGNVGVIHSLRLGEDEMSPGQALTFRRQEEAG